ncbi:enoyl-CoA hydratase/isomerase family protein [Muricoccus vinaceus]|uniref:Enoyl-CoA hydratase/isomerase family protein n=1 Tax=Muricoccus vinaceus TaxID=424704 RepID=A0ABV6INI8_9PROT
MTHPAPSDWSAAGLLYEEAGGIATVAIDRATDLNRLDVAALRALQAITDHLATRTDIQVFVITGSGSKIFSMGMLNPELRGSLSKEAVLEIVFLANAVFDAIEALPQIVIASINGILRAGAVELALACDIRLAARHANLAMPEARWGGFPGAGAPVRLPLTVGRARAIELICTGREVDAAEMERLGLVQAVLDGDQLAVATQAMAAAIAASGPLAIRGAKRIVAARTEPGFRAARDLSDSLRRALEWSEDVAEGIAAHHEGRPPTFNGR